MRTISAIPDPSGGRRLTELDAVRGLASLTVVFLHFHDMWMPNSLYQLPHWKRVALLLLKPFYSGSEAVILFFVLSGLVLSLPYLRGRGQSYPIYLLRRTLRIYGPYLAALALAVGGAAIWHGHPYHGDWAASHWSQPISFRLVGQHIAFIGVYDCAQYDFVIWSLIQEMRISLLFPALFSLVLRLGAVPSVMLGLALSLSAISLVPAYPDLSARYNLSTTLHYTACFIVGILLSSKLDNLEAWWRTTSFQTHLLLASGSLITYAYEASITKRLFPLLLHGHTVTTSASLMVGNWITMVGTVGLIILALNASLARRILNKKSPQFLGKLSYSLYLVHPIVLHALTFACHDRITMWLQFPIYLAASLLLAWLFYLAVENTFISLSRSVA